MLYQLSQTLVSPSGAPLANAVIRVVHSGATTARRLYNATGMLLSDVGQAVTDANGSFSVYVGSNLPSDLILPNFGGVIRNVAPAQPSAQSADQRTFELRIDTAANQVYGVTLFAPFSGVITKTVTKSLAGACAGTVGIAGVLIGTADAVTTAVTAVSQTTNNVFTKGQAITYTVGASPTATGVNVTLVVTKTGN